MSEQVLSVVVFYGLLFSFIACAWLVVNKGPAVKRALAKLLGRRMK